MNVPVKIPAETEQVGDSATVPDIEQVASFGEKFEPETSTVDPGGPEDGFREIEGALRVVVEVWLEVELVVVEDVVRLVMEVVVVVIVEVDVVVRGEVELAADDDVVV